MNQIGVAGLSGQKTAPLIVAVDDGYARTKVCIPGSTSDDAVWASLPVIREFGTAITSRPNALTGADGRQTGTWEADGTQYTVSENIAGDNTSTDDYHWSPMNRVLVNHYLCECGLAGKEIDVLFVGLPMKTFFSGGKPSDAINWKIENLMKPVVNVGNTPAPPKIKRIEVRPQGLSALFDHMYNWDLQMTRQVPKRAVIIDIGGKTTDLAYVIGGNQLQTNQSNSLDLGVLDVQKELRRLLVKKYRIPGELPADIMDDAIRLKTAPIFQRVVDISDLVAEAVRSHATMIKENIKALLGNTAIADEILLVGGGAAVFAEAMREEYPYATVPENPSWANVRGFWKMGALPHLRSMRVD